MLSSLNPLKPANLIRKLISLKAPSFRSAIIIEDEIHLLVALKIALRKLGIPAQSAQTLNEASKMISYSAPDLLLLDRSLPDGDGFDFCSSLRETGFSGTILILTASGQIHDKVEGLNRGADDYLAKPFSWEELEARIRALARRRAPIQTPSRLWVVDTSRQRIFGPKGWVELTALEFKLAQTLIQAQGKIISRADLLKDVWGFDFLPQTRTVDFFLSRLRKRFEPNPEKPVHFVTVRSIGYKFYAESIPVSASTKNIL